MQLNGTNQQAIVIFLTDGGGPTKKSVEILKSLHAQTEKTGLPMCLFSIGFSENAC
jgi:hypothetical protein